MIVAITPSKITSERRAGMAKTAADGLYSAAPWMQHVVIDSSPDEFHGRAAAIYARSKVFRSEANMRDATIDALQRAASDGASDVFIHLDDMFYGPKAGNLLTSAEDAMQNDLASVVHLSNYPILDPGCVVAGNMTHIVRDGDGVSFDDGKVRLTPGKAGPFGAYTLWSAPISRDWHSGPFWPLAMWFAVYNTKLLESLLTYPAGASTLGAVEVFYRDKANLGRVLAGYPVRVGFVNMQHGGIEMHHNASNYAELANSPNSAVR